MDLATIEIPEEEAREKLAEYEQAVKAERSVEDEAIAAGYRAAARGLSVISMQRTIAAGGFHDNSLPRIAVVRADATECFAWWDDGAVVFADEDWWRINQGALVNHHSVRVPVAGDDRPSGQRGHWRAGSTIVPLVPPRFRPRPRRLRACHILWEVESWTRMPPVDPALIKHIRGDLWAVLACWNLTELERLVLSQRSAR